MEQLIECVPNISEGRRPEVIAQFVALLSTSPDTRLLNHSSDRDHNRSVFTFVTKPQNLKQIILGMFDLASSLIDMRYHQGEHPRIGAIDVVPLIPIQSATIVECDKLSQDIAATIAEKFDLPVFLYAESARNESRKSLPKIRKGQFEGLAEKLLRNEWMPDYGPRAPHPTIGATVIGARKFLIAYNILLDTPDIQIARQIASSVRSSSGGLSNVQAMGIYLAERNLAQVSMNLLDFNSTSIPTIYDAVKLEANRCGCRTISSELIGLAPKAAFGGINPSHFNIENWNDQMILENALSSAPSERVS